MMARIAIAVALSFGFASWASAQEQEIVISVNDDLVAEQGAILRGLDRVTGKTADFDLAPGATHTYERLEVSLTECRYPEGQADVEASAYLVIRDIRQDEPSFEGWMFASSPALSSLDHPRYDVWVLRCKT